MDTFQIRGLFINWWNENKFDLRTIAESGWHQALFSNFDLDSEDENGKTVKTIIDKNIKQVKYFFKDKFEEEFSQLNELNNQKRPSNSKINKINFRILFKLENVLKNVNDEQAQNLVLMKMYENLSREILNSYLTKEKQLIVKYFENLWDKYGVALINLESERDEFAQELNGYLGELGYE